MVYLNFNELDDYLAHIAETRLSTRLGITSVLGPAGQFGERAVTYYATATCCVGEHIVTWAMVILQTDSWALRLDKDKPESERAHTKLHDNFAKVRAQLEARGVLVERGHWQIEAPEYLAQGG